MKSRSGFPTGRRRKTKRKSAIEGEPLADTDAALGVKPQSTTGAVAQCLSALVADRWADRPPRDCLVRDEDQVNIITDCWFLLPVNTARYTDTLTHSHGDRIKVCPNCWGETNKQKRMKQNKKK